MKQKTLWLTSAALTCGVLLTGCTGPSTTKKDSQLLHQPPHGVYYEVFVRSFADSNGDGVGDLKGLTAKLDYLQDLGIEGLWLMPINSSPSYHGYDVTDYKGVNPDYGTADDLKQLVAEAHKRHMSILLDFVVNHTSNQHPWFQQAESSPTSPYRDYYIWANSTTNTKQRGDTGQELWHGSPGNEYYAYFYEGMPDLNFDNPKVRQEITQAGQYWLKDIGIDGFRLDAAKHIYADPEPTRNVQWWQEFRKSMEEVKPDVFLVGEVWDSPYVVAPYLKGLNSTFNFDLSKVLVSAAQNESDQDLVSQLVSTRQLYEEEAGKTYIDSTFLTNHDMDRVMSQLDGNMDHAKMAASLLMTLPGDPFVYYGEEIGMEGKKPDEAIREPFLWKKDSNAPEQTHWEVSKYNSDNEQKSLEAEQSSQTSLYAHYKALIHARRSSDVLIQGDLAEVPSLHADGLLAFKRTLGDKSLLVVHNLSGKAQNVTLDPDLKSYKTTYFTTTSDAQVKSGKIALPPYSTLILQP
ncbi:alpha-glucosidase C-terminal domain-containing protein [Tumebacillus sp. ITR2]|uniref:Alpha-glucosidase C-terminal domain-containing protein n=1 Tax=Tumebacillus amylolyticus TaxID=2801339 RepID=A0ABS1JDD7_9BACL|nr:alpha-amylase family glycosyl hydrolase [Tumebacillus amylolyticus]MBL0388220.1 alpha-glucosidase C-terminal domain-containing protein [Tumebacillus amylolyticus]